MRICTFSTKIMNLAWFYFRFNRCFRQISFLGSSFLEKRGEDTANEVDFPNLCLNLVPLHAEKPV